LPFVSTVTPGERTGEAQAVGVTLNPALGAVIVQTYDCHLNAGIGVQLSLTPTDPSTQLFYIEQNFLSATQDGTGPNGRALFVTAPPQTQLLVESKPKSLGVLAGQEGFFVPADGIAFVMLPPTP